MKKWLYIIAPAAMLVVFTFFYFSQAKELAHREAEREAQIEKDRKAEDARRAAIEEKARLDATQRNAEREADAAAKEVERLAKWAAEGKEIEDAANAYNAEADKYAKAIAALEIRLDTLRKDKESLNTTVLGASKRVEQARIDKRNAELEIQRKTEVMVRRAESSPLTQIPVATAPAR